MKMSVIILCFFAYINLWCVEISIFNTMDKNVKLKYFYKFREYCYNIDEIETIEIPSKSEAKLSIESENYEMFFSFDKDCNYPQTVVLYPNSKIELTINSERNAFNDIVVNYNNELLDSIAFDSMTKQDDVYRSLLNIESFNEFRKELNKVKDKNLENLWDNLNVVGYENLYTYFSERIRHKYNYIYVDYCYYHFIINVEPEAELNRDLFVLLDTNVINSCVYSNMQEYERFMKRYEHIRRNITRGILFKKYAYRLYEQNFNYEIKDEFFSLYNYGLKNNAIEKLHYYSFLYDIENNNDESICLKIDSSFNNEYYIKKLKTICNINNQIYSAGFLPYDSFKQHNGQDYNLHNHKGKVLLISFWSKGCRPCIQNIPKLEKVKEAMKNEKFDILYVSVDKYEEFLKIKHLVNENIFKSICIEGGWSSTYLKQIYASALPRYILLGNNNELLDVHYSIYDENQVINDVKKHLE